jgi:hypothetical protein
MKKILTHYRINSCTIICCLLVLFLSCKKDVNTTNKDSSTIPTVPRAVSDVIGKIITLKGNNGKYISSENGTQAMTCNRETAGAWEQFMIIDCGNGKVKLLSMGKFVSSENGAQPVDCNRVLAQDWEQFTWITNGNGTISLQGNNSNYISSENGTQAITCYRSPAQAWEQFTYSVVSTAKVLNYLYTISSYKTVAGQQGLQYWQPMHDITGKYPGYWGEDYSFQPFQGTSTMAEWRSLVNSTAKQRWASGAMVGLMFHACPPTQAEPCQWEGGVKSTLTDTQWTDLVTDGGTLNQNWKARLDIFAGYLQDLKNNGVQVIFRPFHEMNQGVFWWAGRPGPNGTAKLYRLTHDYLVNTKGLTNLIWVWNLQDFSTLNSDLSSYDPGPDYWDVLALDVYYSDQTGFTAAKYNAILNKAGSKPIAISECGSLPSAATLSAQPRWVYFNGWAELTQQQNSNAVISSLYNAGNVNTLTNSPGW